jgi:hypothetical protein
MPNHSSQAGVGDALAAIGVLDRCEAVPKLIGNPQDFPRIPRTCANRTPTTMPVPALWVALRLWASAWLWRSRPGVSW